MDTTNFEHIRPYNEDEIPAAMHRIADSEAFPLLSSFVYPGKNIDEMREKVRGFKTIYDFQHQAMTCMNEQVIKRSITNFTYNGLNHLDKNKCYLFISNHRDIVLDSSLLQYILHTNGYDTTEITFGANLMCSPLVIDIGKSNKMFRVERTGGDMREFYKSSQNLSKYIHYVITEKKQSVWIAQRNGRTKNGIDNTDQGLIKMLCMNDPNNKIEALDQLNIVPISISYEWESCDILKTLELYESRYSKHIKKPGEDLNSIITGLVSRKGDVHIEICKPISTAELMLYDECTNNEYHRAISALIDSRINESYKLTSNNYIAYDLRYGCGKYKAHYTQKQKDMFVAHLHKLAKYDTCELDILTDILLGIYSNPVINL